MAQPSVFSHIAHNDDVDTFLPLSSAIKCFLCAVVVTASCLLSSDKNSETLRDVDMIV